jgi:nicotinate-nucleotide adenylyltransferase
MGQLAIFGGTFDPVHWGHLVVAQTALSQLSLERVIWVPTRHPPHKRGSAYEHRRLMLERAIADNPAFVLSPMETDYSSTNYAVGTLAYLQDIYPNHQWYWVIGLDAFQTLPRWYCRERLIPACDWLVAPRFMPVSVADAHGSSRTIFNELEYRGQETVIRVAINGFGRIGRNFMRCWLTRDK